MCRYQYVSYKLLYNDAYITYLILMLSINYLDQ